MTTTTGVISSHVRLDSNGPVDLARAGFFLAGWPPATHSGTDLDGALRLAFVTDDYTGSVAVAVRQAGPEHVDAVFSAVPTPAMVDQVRRIFGLDLDGPSFERLAGRDPALARLQESAPGARPVLFASPYEAAAWAVLSARTPAARAATHRRHLITEFGTTHEIDGHTARSFPAPHQLRRLETLPGLSDEKVRRLHGVADAAEDGRLSIYRLAGQPHDQALSDLKTIRGIGDFYALLICVRALPGADIIPIAEPRLLAAASRLFGRPRPLTPAELAHLTISWTPHRSWAGFLLRTT